MDEDKNDILTQKVNRLFSFFNKKLTDLSQEELDQVNDLKDSNVKVNIVSKIALSIKDYIDKHPEVKENLQPGTLGSILLGCNDKDNLCPLVALSEDTNIFMINDEGIIQHILLKPSFNAIIYINKDQTLSSDHLEELGNKGIAKYSLYTLEGKHISDSNIDNDESNQHILMIILVLCLILFGSFLFFGKMF
jgi:hypothetical protein